MSIRQHVYSARPAAPPQRMSSKADSKPAFADDVIASLAVKKVLRDFFQA